jgi:hypothetical protein
MRLSAIVRQMRTCVVVLVDQGHLAERRDKACGVVCVGAAGTARRPDDPCTPGAPVPGAVAAATIAMADASRPHCRYNGATVLCLPIPHCRVSCICCRLAKLLFRL